VPERSKVVITRRKIRIKVFQAVFAWMSAQEEPAWLFERILQETGQVLRAQQKTADAGEALTDWQFMEKLFYTTIREHDAYLQLIQERLQNWDMHRVALADRVLILLGLTEILHFEQIPVKVTINEYLEIAKEFSTERSASFINGVLDSLQLQLAQAGEFTKSGRGLL